MRSVPFQQREIQLMLFAIVLREDDAIRNDGRGCGIPDQIVIERNFRPFQRVFIQINGAEKPLQAVGFAGKKAVHLLILDSGEAPQFQTVACVTLDEAQIALLIHRLEGHKIIPNRCADQEIAYLRESGYAREALQPSTRQADGSIQNETEKTLWTQWEEGT